MKKLSFLILAFVASVGIVNAQTKKHEIGVVVGNFQGVSYRYNLNEHLSIQTDFGWKMLTTGKGSESWNSRVTIDGVTVKNSSAEEEREFKKNDPEGWRAGKAEERKFSCLAKAWSLEVNPNILYHNVIKEGSWGSFSWLAGGGLSLGFGRYCTGTMFYEGEYFDTYTYWNHYGPKSAIYPRGEVSGKFGLNAVGGVELQLSSLPLAFSFDFRPGYCLYFDNYSDSNKDLKMKASSNSYGSAFDWTLALGVRYRF